MAGLHDHSRRLAGALTLTHLVPVAWTPQDLQLMARQVSGARGHRMGADAKAPNPPAAVAHQRELVRVHPVERAPMSDADHRAIRQLVPHPFVKRVLHAL